MTTKTLIILFSLVLLTYTVSFIKYIKYRSDRKNNQSRMLQLPLFHAFLIGPLLFFMINQNERREKRRFLGGNKRRFS
ncbi:MULTISPECIES: hypothetical protein [Roseivirga]|uniref:hypothetical protein n=1 Tax=Roseivirga TaxID=290180 RepID=UPI000B2BFD23|nr:MULTISPECIES: hypothetical protein [Roseivirga]MBO6660432.1 hypothetical protein [Roseivirga sp.]MBO6759824.1 hypothetical protein [Roseivirga sp.]MBO6906831.1 hypothetical protein [Roseivirga sp.]WPZ09229.1 hypothetical protein T7867_13280 [Roseivirga spongicola]